MKSFFLITTILWFSTLFLLAESAEAFKLRTHIFVANESLHSIIGSNANAVINTRSLGDLPLMNPQVIEAVRAFPDSFRAGTLGPDVYPDLIAGQMWVHTNNGTHKSHDGCMTAGDCMADNIPFELRPVKYWRSVDYGMHLLKQALDIIPNPSNPEDIEQRQRSIAFAYGYLAHMIGDGFAHSFVNEWVRSAWNLTSNNSGAFYGPPTEEIQHMAIEEYIDAHLPKLMGSELTINAPINFLSNIFQSSIPQQNGNSEEGAFGGPYFVELIKIRNTLKILGDSRNWASNFSGIGDISQAAINLLNLSSTIGSLGTDIGNPIRDIEDYFQRRYTMINTFLTDWVILSECVAQNLVLGANAESNSIVMNDDCQRINFESDLIIADIFKGNLNAAAHYGKDQFNFDYGRFTSNVQKQQRYIKEILYRGLVFTPSEDIRSIRVIKRLIENCDSRLIEWGSCDNACTAARNVCTTVHEMALCATCPTKEGKYDCSPIANSVACLFQPHCVACAGNVVKLMTDPVCTATVNSALPVCEFCSTNTICAHLNQLRLIDEAMNSFVRKTVEILLNPLVEKVKLALLESYFGPYTEAYLTVYKEWERRRSSATPSWFVNIAFLREDFQHDPAHLNLVLEQILGVSGSFVDNGLAVVDAIEDTILKTRQLGEVVLERTLILKTGAYESLWRNLITTLYRIARDPTFDVTKHFDNTTNSWIDDFIFRSNDVVYETRFARFLALMAKINALASIEGSTVKALKRTMKLTDNSKSNSLNVLDSDRFHVLSNAIQLTKLGFMSAAGISELGRRASLSFIDGNNEFGFNVSAYVHPVGQPHQPSQICRTHPHILCDGIASLDDPNNYGAQIAIGSSRPDGNRADFQRSLTIWASRNDAFNDIYCNTGMTGFLLAGRPETIAGVYNQIFTFPDHCIPFFSLILPLLNSSEE